MLKYLLSLIPTEKNSYYTEELHPNSWSCSKHLNEHFLLFVLDHHLTARLRLGLPSCCVLGNTTGRAHSPSSAGDRQDSATSTPSLPFPTDPQDSSNRVRQSCSPASLLHFWQQGDLAINFFAELNCVTWISTNRPQSLIAQDILILEPHSCRLLKLSTYSKITCFICDSAEQSPRTTAGWLLLLASSFSHGSSSAVAAPSSVQALSHYW